MENNTEITGSGRDEQGRFKPGFSGNPDGSKPMSEEQKLANKIRKEVVDKIKEEYILKLAENLPEISPALLIKAKEGDVPAIKEIHDRVFGKTPQSIDMTSKGEAINQLLVRFIDGKPNDNNGYTKGVPTLIQE